MNDPHAVAKAYALNRPLSDLEQSLQDAADRESRALEIVRAAREGRKAAARGEAPTHVCAPQPVVDGFVRCECGHAIDDHLFGCAAANNCSCDHTWTKVEIRGIRLCSGLPGRPF